MDRRGAQRILARGDALCRVERDGEVLRTAHGRPGRPARTTVRIFSSHAAAEQAYAHTIEALQSRNYHHAVAPPGWPDVCHPPEAVHDRFEHRLQNDPHASGLAESYVTWLAGQHDPRGTLGALQRRGAQYSEEALRAARRFAWLLTRPRDGETPLPPSWSWRSPRSAQVVLDPRSSRAAAERALLEQHGHHFFGDLRGHEDRFTFTWHRGFLDTATLHLGESSDDEDDDPIDDSELLRRLLRLRSARLLRALVIELPDWDDFSGDDGETSEPIDLLAGILAGPPVPALRSFSLVREPCYDNDEDDDFYDPDTARDEAPVLGALAGLADLFPRLEHLALAGRDLDLGAWRFPHLRHAELHFARPEQPTVAAFARAAWPRLTSLRLGLGNFLTNGSADEALAVLGPILTAERLPQLRHLALVHPPDADAVCAVLARSPAAARLETLEISDSNLTGAGARELARARPRFTRLRRLDLCGNLLAAADERRLRRAFADVQLHTGPQRSPEPRDLDDDEYAESLRRAALGGTPLLPSGQLHSDDDLPDNLDDRFELLLDRVVVDPPTTEEDPRLRRAALVDPPEPGET